MPHWLIKSAAQRAFSWLPGSRHWNDLFQKYVTGSLELTRERFDGRLEYCRTHLDHFLQLWPDCADAFTVLEIGTGWYPVVPIGLYLCGASEIWTFDIVPLLESGRLKRVLEQFSQQGQSGALQKALPRLRPERLERLNALARRAGGRERPAAILAELNIHPHVRDARDSRLAAGTVDLFTSTGVLEYIPREVLQGLLAECGRVGTVRATHSHYLNLVDEYSYFDSSITPINFLQYSASRWKYLNSPLTWQNRLRISDFRALFTEAGCQITKEVNTSAPIGVLQRVRLAPEFQHYRPDDLLVVLSWLVARPVGNRAGPSA